LEFPHQYNARAISLIIAPLLIKKEEGMKREERKHKRKERWV